MLQLAQPDHREAHEMVSLGIEVEEDWTWLAGGDGDQALAMVGLGWAMGPGRNLHSVASMSTNGKTSRRSIGVQGHCSRGV